MSHPVELDQYDAFLREVKQRIATARVRAALAVNAELVALYWQIGRLILERQERHGWGGKGIDRLSVDLRTAFPGARGFSRRNLHYGWSRDTLAYQIRSGLHIRQGKATSNFDRTLPPSQSEFAREALKSPYNFEFLGLEERFDERTLESALTERIQRFLLELGRGFAFVGRQYRLEVGGDEFFVDLLFYHLHLRCFIVVELKTREFTPEDVGKVAFWLRTAIDEGRRVYLEATS